MVAVVVKPRGFVACGSDWCVVVWGFERQGTEQRVGLSDGGTEQCMGWTEQRVGLRGVWV